MKHIVGLSGGKDSTALALRLQELHPERDFEYLITPTGDELPEMIAHWEKLEGLLGKPLTRITNGTLKSWISEWKALPNWRQRWCTRVLKIEPTIAYLHRVAPATHYVGLRADESEKVRKGIEGDFRGIENVFPLREWGWGLQEVLGYLKVRGVKIPKRTDCARCYGQRLGEWEDLYWSYPDIYADSAKDEADTGHTFRSPGRDTKPAALKDLAEVFKARGVPIRQVDEDEDGYGACRVCRL